jgi:tetratricopeptide (TPR) repeat protein
MNLQEAKCYALYQEAIEAASVDPASLQAEDSFRKLLQQPLLLQVRPASNVLRLQYLTLKNLGSVLRAQNKLCEAIDEYLKASKIDGSDFMLWHNIGTLGLELGEYAFARRAFET